jgi:hypothetical protein
LYVILVCCTKKNLASLVSVTNKKIGLKTHSSSLLGGRRRRCC